MSQYKKRIQVLVTEEQFTELEEIASKQGKKLGTLVREAIEEYHLKAKRQREIEEAVDNLLSLPEVPAPEDYQEWEAQYLDAKGRCR